MNISKKKKKKYIATGFYQNHFFKDLSKITFLLQICRILLDIPRISLDLVGNSWDLARILFMGIFVYMFLYNTSKITYKPSMNCEHIENTYKLGDELKPKAMNCEHWR